MSTTAKCAVWLNFYIESLSLLNETINDGLRILGSGKNAVIILNDKRDATLLEPLHRLLVVKYAEGFFQ